MQPRDSVFSSHVGHIFLDVHEAQPRFGAKLVIKFRHKITVFIHNSGRSLELVDFLTSFRLMSITSRIFLKMFVLRGELT